jgi:hypothetical protein
VPAQVVIPEQKLIATLATTPVSTASCIPMAVTNGVQRMTDDLQDEDNLVTLAASPGSE